MKQLIPLAAALLLSTGAAAQTATKQWTLQECIQYAIDNNITLKQKEQEQEARKVDLHTSKHAWLPDLNASMGQNFEYGRSASKDGTIVDSNSSNTSLGVNLSMPIFDGLKIPNDIAARKFDLQASFENLSKAKEDISMSVASYYLETLYNKELERIAILQAQLSKEQIDRTALMVEAGKVPLSQLYDMKAQAAKDEVTLTESANNVKLSLLGLSQALELERLGGFDIQTPQIEDAVVENMSSIVPPDHVFDHAVTFKPQIREQDYLLESDKRSLRIAQSGYYPKLNFNASYSTGYYSSMKGVDFGEQFSKNGRNYLGFSLSIPLFNRFKVSNSVRSARIAIQNRELVMENTKKTLYKEIQQAYYNATASQEKFIASGKSVTASKEAFSYAEQRYNAGKSTVFEYNEAKTKYSQSLAEQAQAKYMFIFRAKMLDFYNGVPIAL